MRYVSLFLLLLLLAATASAEPPGLPSIRPAAQFDEAYRSTHQGKTFVEVPEVYELVNIAIAMTPTGIGDRELVYHDSEYYERMRAWFDKHRDQPLLAALDAELAANPNQYFTLKMNGYAFEYDAQDKLVPSKVYDRTGFTEESRNTLRPYLEKLQAFSDATGFRRFFRENAATYQDQITFFRDIADVGEMKRWLDRNFPTSSDYDCYKIIFSPLVAYNQSATWLESNGFKELQAHVNYPYPQALTRYIQAALSPRAAILYRGNIVFTELNHGYINPEADKYSDRILKAVSDRDHWVDKSKGPDYYPAIDLFNEYMNWGLVTLRLADYAPPDELAGMIAGVDRMMAGRRGFLRFKEFDAFLMDLYRARKPSQTLADLYPQIIEWFEKNGRRENAPPPPPAGEALKGPWGRVRTAPTLPPGAGDSVRIDSEASARAPEAPRDLDRHPIRRWPVVMARQRGGEAEKRIRGSITARVGRDLRRGRAGRAGPHPENPPPPADFQGTCPP